eukprot:SAG11_NODE_2337_length_3500_cov_62.684505_2_plen_57_part_00
MIMLSAIVVALDLLIKILQRTIVVMSIKLFQNIFDDTSFDSGRDMGGGARFISLFL